MYFWAIFGVLPKASVSELAKTPKIGVLYTVSPKTAKKRLFEQSFANYGKTAQKGAFWRVFVPTVYKTPKPPKTGFWREGQNPPKKASTVYIFGGVFGVY